MTPIFKQASGKSPLVDVLNVARACLQERTPMDSGDIIFEKRTDGFRAILKKKAEEKPQPSGDARWS